MTYYGEEQRWVRLLPTIGVAMLAIFLASFILSASHTGEQKKAASDEATVESTPLGLRVKAAPQQIQLYWNHDASAIREAEKGVIDIWDGDVSQEIPFAAGQLQDGALVYKPRTNDIMLRMAVDEKDGRQITESLRAVATP